MGGKGLKRGLDALKRRVARAVDEANAASDVRTTGSRSRVTIAGRTNLVTAANVGELGSSRRASGSQRVRIRQAGGRTVEDTETTEATS